MNKSNLPNTAPSHACYPAHARQCQVYTGQHVLLHTHTGWGWGSFKLRQSFLFYVCILAKRPFEKKDVYKLHPPKEDTTWMKMVYNGKQDILHFLLLKIAIHNMQYQVCTNSQYLVPAPCQISLC